MSQISALPETSRIWIFSVQRELLPEQQESLVQRLEEFIGGWKSHGNTVAGAFELRHNKFVVVAADPGVAEVSGCSIDSLFRNISAALNDAGIAHSDFSRVHFLEGEKVKEATREDFARLVHEGKVNASTIVFDNTIQSLGDYQNGKWQLPFSQSWHAKVFAVSD